MRSKTRQPPFCSLGPVSYCLRYVRRLQLWDGVYLLKEEAYHLVTSCFIWFCFYRFIILVPGSRNVRSILCKSNHHHCLQPCRAPRRASPRRVSPNRIRKQLGTSYAFVPATFSSKNELFGHTNHFVSIRRPSGPRAAPPIFRDLEALSIFSKGGTCYGP